MTKQSEIINDPRFKAVLDHGFVGLIDHMGNDEAIVQAARTSYGDGTKTVLEDRGLIRYLMRHKHTSPFEMCQIKLFIKMPIFVMRQWVRHRTASLNEYSGRYSVMTDEFYLPEPEVIQPQSKDNKQGRNGSLGDTSTTGVRWMMETAYGHSYDIYQALLGEKDETKFRAGEVVYDPYDESDPLFGDDFGGIAREMARCVLPVANYTELYWTQNLHNMMHLLKLRMDPHAQYEIRVFADAVYELIKPIYPAALEAFEDYVREAKSLSRMEVNILSDLLSSLSVDTFSKLVSTAGGEKAFAEKYDLSLREFREFTSTWSLISKIEKTLPKLVETTNVSIEVFAEPKPKPEPKVKPVPKAKAKPKAKATKAPTKPARERKPGGPEYAADGSKMGWVGKEWLPIGEPPPSQSTFSIKKK